MVSFASVFHCECKEKKCRKPGNEAQGLGMRHKAWEWGTEGLGMRHKGPGNEIQRARNETQGLGMRHKGPGNEIQRTLNEAQGLGMRHKGPGNEAIYQTIIGCMDVHLGLFSITRYCCVYTIQQRSCMQWKWFQNQRSRHRNRSTRYWLSAEYCSKWTCHLLSGLGPN